MRKTTALLALGAVLAFAAGCGDDDDESGAATDAPATTETAAEPAPTEDGSGGDTGTDSVGTADVTLTDFEIELARDSFPKEGVYTLRVVNEGDTVHALEAEGPNGETETEEIEPGATAELDAYFVTGRYRLYCPVGDHEQRGMTARLRVGA